ncbi:MFS general substrate transporter [Mycena vulgaris]|nr:MFS general substrate transporter [Mycena vulgaris]
MTARIFCRVITLQIHQASWLGIVSAFFRKRWYLRFSQLSFGNLHFTPFYGRLCNVIGRRGANQMAIYFAALGTIGCGLSRNMETLIAARFITDVGGGGIFTTLTNIVSDMYTLRDRGLVQGAASSLQLCSGLGGLFAFLLQFSFYLSSFVLNSCTLRYVTPGKSKGAKEVLSGIDYFGSLTMFISVGSLLLFLSMQYNETLPWSDVWIVTPLVMASVFIVLFLNVEMFVASDQIPVLVGASNFLSATCNFSVNYFFPVWFQVARLESASTAGLHLMPNGISMSTGSVFAGWMMHRTGRYKAINLIFAIFPFVSAVLIPRIREDSVPLQSWLRIQTNLTTELRQRIHTPNAEDAVQRFIRTLEPIEEQRAAQDAYTMGLKSAYVFAACATLLASIARLPIPDQDLDKAHSRRRQIAEADSTDPAASSTASLGTGVAIQQDDREDESKSGTKRQLAS